MAAFRQDDALSGTTASPGHTHMEPFQKPNLSHLRDLMATGPYPARYWHTDLQSVLTLAGTDELLLHLQSRSLQSPNICIIENASFSDLEKLHHTWNLDLDFLIHHASLCLTPARGGLPSPSGSDSWACLEGMYNCQEVSITREDLQRCNTNHCWQRGATGTDPVINFSTRMSYYRVTAHFYVFLVDAPVSCLDGGPGCASVSSLSFPYGIDGCHLELLYYGPGVPNLYSILQYVSLSAWTYEYLFAESSACISPMLLFHVMSAVAIHVDLQGTTVHVQHLGAIEVDSDTIIMPDSLPAIRVGLMTTRTTIDYTIANAHPHVRPALEAQIHGRESILQRLERQGIWARDLDQFAVQTIQLYANLITIRHGKLNVEQARESLEQSKAAVKQAKQGIFLTRLAAVYLPLSLATGIFGMNTKEINPEAIPNWKVAVITATILLTITIIITVAGGAWGASLSWLRWIPRLIKSCRQRKDYNSIMSSIPPRPPTPPGYDKKARLATKSVWELAP